MTIKACMLQVALVTLCLLPNPASFVLQQPSLVICRCA